MTVSAGRMPAGASNKFVYDTSPDTGSPSPRTSGTTARQHPWEFKRVWHLEPSLTDPDTVYAGVEDAALFRSTDGGQTWQELAGLRGHGTGPKWQPGAGGMCLHTILLDPERPGPNLHRHLGRGRLPHRRRRQDLEADQPRAEVPIHPRPDGRGRPLRSPHRHAPLAPERAVHAEALGRDAQRRRAATPGTRSAATCPPTSASPSTSTPTSRKPSTSSPSRATRSTFRPRASCASTAAAPAGTSGRRSTNGLPQSDCYVNVLRDAMAVDSLDSCGVYFGTTGGQVYASADAGDNWAPIVRDLPAVLSVEVQTLP